MKVFLTDRIAINIFLSKILGCELVMGLFDTFIKKIKYRNTETLAAGPAYEFCPRCDANLTLQKGYSNELPFWNCRGCGEMLINPEVDAEDDIVWICDGCGTMLNIQDGFNNNCGSWECTECGFVNKIDASEMYLSEDEFQASLRDPYKGLMDEEVLALSIYDEEGAVEGHPDIILVKNMVDDKKYVKKILSVYDANLYRYLMNHPISNMPKIYGVYESDNNLIVIEEYIEGRTLLEILDQSVIDPTEAVYIARRICYILKELHGLEKPIIHRDIKPSNIIIADDGKAYLIDINVAKWYKEESSEDTKLMGTIFYAAPEQFGYGFSASSAKSDIYAVGMLLNVMITGKLPKEEKAPEAVWSVIEKCIELKPEDRYSDDELISALDSILR